MELKAAYHEHLADIKHESARKNTRLRSCTTFVAAILEPEFRQQVESQVEILIERAMANVNAGNQLEAAVAEAMANAPRESELGLA